MFFVEARYHRDPDRAGGQVRYIANREEGLTDGLRRELYGIGERYRSFGATRKQSGRPSARTVAACGTRPTSGSL